MSASGAQIHCWKDRMNRKESAGQGFRFNGLSGSLLVHNGLTFWRSMSVKCIFIMRRQSLKWCFHHSNIILSLSTAAVRGGIASPFSTLVWGGITMWARCVVPSEEKSALVAWNVERKMLPGLYLKDKTLFSNFLASGRQALQGRHCPKSL